MRKLYFLLLLSLLRLPALHAQQPDSLSLQLNAVFANLDKSQVPTRLLADFALPLVPLPSFNGTLADSTRTTPTLFRALYATAYTSCIYGSNPLATLPAYNAQVEAVETGSPTLIPIMVQRLDYAQLRPDALSQNLLRVQNNQLFDVPGRSQSPYQTRALFVAAPSREVASSRTVTFMLPRALYVEYLPASRSTSLRSLELDAGDGAGYRPTGWDQRLVISYASAGNKRIKVRFTYQQSAQAVPYESQFDLYVPQGISQSSGSPLARTNNLAGLANDSVAFAAAPGQAAGKIYIRYAASRQTSHKLFKPLIVLEGYDKHYIAPHISPLNYSLDKFLKEINTAPGFNLGESLENTGDYDIVFVDYANGTDDILLNAGLFERVLNYVNTNKDPASTEQNVVMGMSMGGLIGRYKLAQLEKASPGSTHVRLLILQDSPQRGANLPLGIAAAVQQANNSVLRGIPLKEINTYIKEAVALFNQPATRQLLKYQALGPNSSDFFANTFIDGPYRQMVNYAAPYRIVAVSQGSQCGVGLFPPYTELARASASSFNGVLGYFIRTYLPAIPGYGGEVVLNALPDGGQSARVSGLFLYLQTRILRVIPLKVTLTRQNFFCPTGLLPLDGAPGSTEPFVGGPNVITDGSPAWLGPLFSYEYALRSRFSFVSPASALDIADFTPPALTARYISNTASFSTSRTNGFIAQERTTLFGNTDFNVPHLAFTARNGEFMFDQMENKLTRADSVACSSECSPFDALAIAGPAFTCAGQSATYTVPGLPAGTSVTWAISGVGLAPAGATTGPSFTASTTGRGQAIVQATLSAPCGQSTTLFINVGAGNPLLIDAQNEQCGFMATAYAPGFTSLQWQLNLDEPAADFQPTVYVPFSHGYASATLSGYNTCTGQYESVAATRRSPPGTYCPSAAPEATLYPNPANQETSVTMSDPAVRQRQPAAPGTKAGTLGVRIYDAHGQLRLERQVVGTTLAHLPTAALPAGLYVVHVLQNGVLVDRQHLQVQR